jgi:hypothetical protein
MKINIKSIFSKKLLIQAAISGGVLLIIYLCLFTSIIRARVVKVESLIKQFEAQFEQDPLKALQQRSIQKIVVQEGFNYDKGLDANCLTWDSEPVVSAWTQDSEDSDFIADYYVPANSEAIICTTPIFAGALTADADKPFSYEVYRTEYGLRVRVIIGVSEVPKLCQMLALDGNCLNSLIKQQAIVRYKPS